MPENKPLTSLDMLRQELRTDIATLRSDQKETNTKVWARLADLEKNEAVRTLALTELKTTMLEMKGDIKTLLEKPGKRYESLGNEVIKWAILGLLTATQIFGK